ncbi:MAG: threonylcarbamoyl-AMP synthase [Synergistaceae bacterium]|nr:threonylcarbamoyl-AMP synthase [Synergistaceae bacterium]
MNTEKVIQTITAKINTWNPEHEIISQAAEIIRSGGLVSFPTETVYGLGADALNADAVTKIYAAKGRPSDNPLILHVAGYSQAESLVYMNDIAKKLIHEFWPAPLTLVLPARNIIPLKTRGGLDTAAIRMPNNPIALALIEESRTPIAAPSANISGRPSPTDYESVYHDMNGRIDMILDGGICDIGIESTVIDVTNPEKILLLRPGGMSIEAIESVINSRLGLPDDNSKKRSPGTRYRHYAPSIPVKIWRRGDSFPDCDSNSCGYMGLHDPECNCTEKIIFDDIKNYTRGLFAGFRKFEREKFSCIVVEWPCDNSGTGAGLQDRITRASCV